MSETSDGTAQTNETVTMTTQSIHTIGASLSRVVNSMNLTNTQRTLLHNVIMHASQCAATGAQFLSLQFRLLIEREQDIQNSEISNMIVQAFKVHNRESKDDIEPHPGTGYTEALSLWNELREEYVPPLYIKGMGQCLTFVAQQYETACKNYAQYGLVQHLRLYLTQIYGLTKSVANKLTETLDSKNDGDVAVGEQEGIQEELKLVPTDIRMDVENIVHTCQTARDSIWEATKLRLQWLKKLEAVDRERLQMPKKSEPMRTTRKFTLLPQYGAGTIYVRFDNRVLKELFGSDYIQGAEKLANGRRPKAPVLTVESFIRHLDKPKGAQFPDSFSTNGVEIHVGWVRLHNKHITRKPKESVSVVDAEKPRRKRTKPRIPTQHVSTFCYDDFASATHGLFSVKTLLEQGVTLENEPHIVGVDPGEAMIFTTDMLKTGARDQKQCTVADVVREKGQSVKRRTLIRCSLGEYYNRIQSRVPRKKKRNEDGVKKYAKTEEQYDRQAHLTFEHMMQTRVRQKRTTRKQYKKWKRQRLWQAKVRNGWKPTKIDFAQTKRSEIHMCVSNLGCYLRGLKTWMETFDVLFQWYGSKQARSIKFIKSQAKRRALDQMVMAIAPNPRTVVAFGNWNCGQAAPVSTFRKYLAKRRRVINVDEFRTSKMCCGSGQHVNKAPKVDKESGRLVYDGKSEVNSANTVRAIVYCPQCEIMCIRDLSAAMNMRKVCLHVLANGGERPEGFRREVKVTPKRGHKRKEPEPTRNEDYDPVVDTTDVESEMPLTETMLTASKVRRLTTRNRVGNLLCK